MLWFCCWYMYLGAGGQIKHCGWSSELHKESTADTGKARETETREAPICVP